MAAPNQPGPVAVVTGPCSGGLCRWKGINKVGRHVGLDFYDLLIEDISFGCSLFIDSLFTSSPQAARVRWDRLRSQVAPRSSPTQSGASRTHRKCKRDD